MHVCGRQAHHDLLQSKTSYHILADGDSKPARVTTECPLPPEYHMALPVALTSLLSHNLAQLIMQPPPGRVQR